MHKFEPFTAAVMVDKKMGIGNGNEMLIHNPAYFEKQMQIMVNHPIIMGRITYERFPWDKVSDSVARRVLLLSETINPQNGVEVFRTVKELVEAAPKRAFVIGGEKVYRSLLPYCDTVLACHVDIELPADKIFPAVLGKDPKWKVCERSKCFKGPHKMDVSYRYVTYRRDNFIEPVRRA